VSNRRTEAREQGPNLGLLDEHETALGTVTEARNSAQEPLIDQRSRIEQRSSALDAELRELREEREAWVAGKDPEPDTPPGRRDRTGLAGAPFWRSVQFREQIADDVRGNVESALADTRVLDAWVSSEDGVSISDGESDLQILLARRPSETTDHEQTLASLL